MMMEWVGGNSLGMWKFWNEQRNKDLKQCYLYSQGRDWNLSTVKKDFAIWKGDIMMQFHKTRLSDPGCLFKLYYGAKKKSLGNTNSNDLREMDF